jgi:hypothetical protein
LPRENAHPFDRWTDSLELRQVRMEVEACDLPKQPTLVESSVNLDRCGRPVRRRRRPQTEAILDRHSEPSQQRPREAAETLAGRNGPVTVVLVFSDLPIETSLPPRIRVLSGTYGLSDIMMRTNEDHVVGVIQEIPDRLDFGRACRLLGAERVEADDHNTIDALEDTIERGHCAIIVDAFDLNDLAPGQRFGLFGEHLEIRLLNVVQKTRNALIDLVGIRELFEFRVEEPTQFENCRKTIVDDGKRRSRFRWTAPGKVEK